LDIYCNIITMHGPINVKMRTVSQKVWCRCVTIYIYIYILHFSLAKLVHAVNDIVCFLRQFHNRIPNTQCIQLSIITSFSNHLSYLSLSISTSMPCNLKWWQQSWNINNLRNKFIISFSVQKSRPSISRAIDVYAVVNICKFSVRNRYFKM